MAPPEFHSPFPTSHDTLGTSTLGTPMYMPSSPPRMSRIPQRTNRKSLQNGPNRADAVNAANAAARRRRLQSRSPSPSMNGRNGESELNNNSEYTLDMSKLPGDGQGNAENDLQPLPERAEVDELSEIGGPEDFTLNMEKYLRSPVVDEEGGQDNREQGVEEGDRKTGEERQPGTSTEDAPDLGEYSEFEPPLDMSTPAHLLSRKHEISKDGSRLADIEEQPDDSPMGRKSTGSERRPNSVNGRMHSDLQKELEEAKAELREKDQLLEVSQGKLLEAISAVDQIQHLNAVVQTKSKLLDEANAKLEGESSLHNQIKQLQSQLDEKQRPTEENRALLEVESLRNQVQLLQRELNSKDMLLNEQKEGSAALLNLRRENEYLKEQLSKQDGALEENMAKMNEVTNTKQRQIVEKDAQIEDLKARQDEQYLKIEKIQAELDSALHDYDTLEEQTESLEDKCQATEKQVRDLQSELSVTKASRNTQYDALKTLANHHSVEVENKSFMELVESLKLGSSKTTTAPTVGNQDDVPQNQEERTKLEKELGDVRSQLQESKSSADILTLKLEHTQELLSESRTFINTVESENQRLVSRVDSLTSELKRTQDNLTSTSQQLEQDRATIRDLQNGNGHENQTQQQPSPPTLPPSTNTSNVDHSMAKEMHQAELTRLQESHAAALSSLRDSHAESILTLHNLLAGSQARETDLKTELNTLRDTSSSQTTQIESLTAELERLKSVIEDKEAAAAALDSRLANSARKREEKWEARVEALLKERERMGKALMWSWGENEVGDYGKVPGETGCGVQGKGKGQGQGYRYKYTKKGAAAAGS